MRLLQEREAELAKLYAELGKGVASAKAGRLIDADEVFDRLEAKYQAMEDAGK